MEDTLRPEVRPAVSDLRGTVDCGTELTRTNSDSSALTAENSKVLFHHNVNAVPCTEWTNEKHGRYLDYLEASFVKQLRHSRSLLMKCSYQNTRDIHSLEQLPASTSDSSCSFLVLQEGSWQKTKARSNQAVTDNAADSHIVLDSPCVRRFRCTEKGRSIGTVNLQHHCTPCSEIMPTRGKRSVSLRFITSQDQHPVSVCHQFHQDSCESITEVSDQNFVDEKREEKPPSLSFVKRLKKVSDGASSNNEILDLGNVLPPVTLDRKKKNKAMNGYPKS